jgi:hypothetical protein
MIGGNTFFTQSLRYMLHKKGAIVWIGGICEKESSVYKYTLYLVELNHDLKKVKRE